MSDDKKDYLLMLQTLLVFLILNGTAKTNLAVLALFYCGEIVKNSYVRQTLTFNNLYFSIPTLNSTNALDERSSDCNSFALTKKSLFKSNYH